MSPQADYVVANGTGAAVRSDINGQLAAIVSNNSGASAPATTYAYQFWADTSTNLLKLRNGANSAWITVGDLTAANLGLASLASPTFTGTVTIPTLTVSTGANIPLGTAASPTLYFTGDTNTGFYSPGADQVAISTAGSGRLFVDASGRLLVGTSTASSAGAYAQYGLIKIQGNSAASGGAAIINIARGEGAATITSGEDLGAVSFTDSAGNEFGTITCAADANAGTNDYPGRLVFSTTSDSASSPSERFRIANNGAWGLAGANYGTSGQVLTSNGASAAPSWASVTGGFAAGTAMLFVQTSAPTGWTKSTTHNDKTLRVVSGAASSGGSTAFSSIFASRTPAGTVGSTTLTESQIPSHVHGFNGQDLVGGGGGGYSAYRNTLNYSNLSSIVTATGGGGSHNHSFSGTAMDFAVQYVDVIIATKD